MVELTLMGHVPSKKNARRVAYGRAYLPAQLKADIDALVIQAQSMRHQLDLEEISGGRIHVSIKFCLRRPHEDLDNCFTTLLDVLQTAGIIQNDKLVRSFTVSEIVDPNMVEQVFIVIGKI